MLAIIVHSLSRVGGTESVVKLLANNLSTKMKVFVIETEKSEYKKSVCDQFEVVNVSSSFKNEKINMVLSMLNARKYIIRHSIHNIYSTFGNLNLLSILYFRGRNVIVCDHLCYQMSMRGPFGYLRKKAYKYASWVVSLTEKDVPNYIGDGDRCVVIENPLDEHKIYNGNFERNDFIAVGRLCFQKNYERMIDIFSYICKVDSSLRLNIFGNGDQDYIDKILNEIKDRKLVDNVFLHKATDNIGEWLSRSKLLIMTSHYEGLPMVLIEAQANGLPCAALDVQTGPSDIIVNRDVGLLMDSGLSNEVIAEMILDYYSEITNENSNAACLNSKRYSVAPVIRKWLEILDA
ncbi:glycosyl transferase [Lelliottia jeotgali]|nr:glycosyl transferase [Lelliottia jeotgali]